MRTRPEPGIYTLTLGGYPYVVTITTTGMTFGRFPFEYEWTWAEIEGGPILEAANAITIPFFVLAFEEPDIVVLRTATGAITGTYTKNT